MAKTNVHNVDPAEDLHKIGMDTEQQVGSKWVEKGVKPVMATEDQRKTGQISSDASKALKESAMTPNY